MKKFLVVLGVTLLLAAGLTGAAYWSGQQAEHWYRQILAESARQSGLHITLTSYQRGWFSSTATTHYQNQSNTTDHALAAPDTETTDLSFSTHETIYHGPLPLMAWGVPGVSPTPAATVIRQTLVPDSSPWTRKLAEWYGNQEPLTVVTRVGFDGASASRVTMPPLTLNQIANQAANDPMPLQNLDFSGLNGQFQMTPGGATVQGDLSVAQLAATAQAKTADAANEAAAIQRVTLRDLRLTANQRKSAFDLLLGDTHFQLGELRIEDAAGAAPALLSRLRLDTTSVVNPQNPQQIDAEVKMQVDKVEIPPWNGVGNFRLALQRLDGAALSQFQQWRDQLPTDSSDPQAAQGEVAALLTLARGLLRGEPELQFDTQGRLAQDDWQGQLRLNFQDYATDGDLAQNPASLLGALRHGSLDLTVAKGLAELLIPEQITALVAAGLVQLHDGHYQVQARFDNGQLLVNGHPIPLGGPPTGGPHGLEPDAAPSIPPTPPTPSTP